MIFTKKFPFDELIFLFEKFYESPEDPRIAKIAYMSYFMFQLKPWTVSLVLLNENISNDFLRGKLLVFNQTIDEN